MIEFHKSSIFDLQSSISTKRLNQLIITLIACILAAITCISTENLSAQEPDSNLPDVAGDAFTFVRIKYDNAGGGLDDDWGWGQWGTWSIDYPDADFNFLRGVTRLTNVHINRDPAVLRLDDDRIF